MEKCFMRATKHFLLLGTLCATSHLYAADLFTAQITVDGQTVPYQSYDKILDLASQYTTKNLQQLIPSYNANSGVTADIKYLGLTDIRLEFSPNSSTLKLNIPSANIYEEFSGSTRNESRSLMVDYLKTAPKEFNEALVGSSSEHPVNQARVASTTATYEANELATNIMAGATPDQLSSVLSIAPRFGRYSQAGVDTDVITLPLSYAKWLPNQNFMLVVDLPLTVTQSEKAIAGQASLGIGINSAVNENWYLMPQVRVGATVSPDFGTSSSLWSTGLTSNYLFPVGESAHFNLINILSYYKTASLKIKDYNAKYDLNNVIYRNGLEYTQALNTGIFNRSIVLKAHVARTDYTGDAVYSKYNHDVGFSIGFKNANAISFLQDLRIGVNYSKGDKDSEGLLVNAGYTF